MFETIATSPQEVQRFATNATFLIVKSLQFDGAWIVTERANFQHPLLISFFYKSDGANSDYLVQAYSLDYQMDMGNDFCNGMSMIMAMGGFQWSLLSKGDCLTYFVAPWKLNDSGTFYGAMVYSFLLAMLTEGITSFQGWVRKFLTGKTRKFTMALLYAVQQWLGYIIMLITMMYSIELFASVLLGLMTGRTLFSNSRPAPRRSPSPDSSSQQLSGTQERGEDTPLLAGSASAVRRRRR
jgi:hypothetical protein